MDGVVNKATLTEYEYMDHNGVCYVCSNCDSYLTKVGYLKPFDASGIPCVEYCAPKFCGYCGSEID